MSNIAPLKIIGLMLVMLSSVVACSGTDTAAIGSVGAPAGNDVEDFRVGVGDKIRVTVFGADKIGGEATVGADGSIYMPLVGAIGVTGKTLSEIAVAVGNRLREEKMVDRPQVSVTLVEARPFFIYGEIVKSGSYPYFPGLNVLSAIATAGGFTYRAKEDHVFVRRGGNGTETYVDITDPKAPPTPVYPGDIIRVPGRLF